MAGAKAKIAARRAGRANGPGATAGVARANATTCWLCTRPLGRRVEWHHPRPKSRGGRETVPVHPICHRAIHAHFTNLELARMSEAGEGLAERPEMARFLRWIAGKPPNFHAPTRRAR